MKIILVNPMEVCAPAKNGTDYLYHHSRDMLGLHGVDGGCKMGFTLWDLGLSMDSPGCRKDDDFPPKNSLTMANFGAEKIVSAARTMAITLAFLYMANGLLL